MEQIDALVHERVGRKIRVAGACIGTDAHTVGIDAILNMKGYKGDYGLERYHEFETHNLGSQVAVEELVRFTKERRIDALLASQAVTQKGSDITNFTALSELLEAENVLDNVVLICGGPRDDESVGRRARLRRRVWPRDASQPSRGVYRSHAGGAPPARPAALVNKTALVTGITEQDGSFWRSCCSRRKGYRVVGITRRTSTEVHERIEHIVDEIEIVSGDLLNQSSITSIVSEVRPHEVYNLAAQRSCLPRGASRY